MNSYYMPEIRVSLTTKADEDDKEYCAVVMDYNKQSKGWYNTGMVHWGSNPTEAFNMALEQYKKRTPNE